jgi:hypothetical protein
MLGARAADAAGLDEINSDEMAVDVDRSMARAFEFPRGNRLALSGVFRDCRSSHHCRTSHSGTPSNAFQIAAPGPIQRLDRPHKYGADGAVPQARKRRTYLHPNRTDSRRGNPGKVNHFCRV